MTIRGTLGAALVVSVLSFGSPPARGSGPEAYTRGVVAADHRVASEAGLEILKQGGNAVDAAVATSFALSVVRPYSCGIGGGGFMVVHLSEAGLVDQRRRGRDPARSIAFDYRERAPGAITPDFYERDADPKASAIGGKAIGVPGTVAGLLAALEEYGTLDRAAVLAPAIRAAEEGFVADADYVRTARDLARSFEASPDGQRRFKFVWTRYLKSGKVRIGDRITQPEQAGALRLIAAEGADAFYRGAIGQAIVRSVRADGGIITAEDLALFRPSRVEPLAFAFRGSTFLTMPPPSSGGVAMGEALGILSALGAMEGAPPVHLMIESFKHAFADRAEWLGDPERVAVPIERLLSDGYIRARAAGVRADRTQGPEVYGTREGPPRGAAEDGGTSHFCVVDATGSAVACTETINLSFGSLLEVEGFGFLLNNQMDDFTTVRGRANAFGLMQSERNLPAPGKRPLSSMTPTIVLDGNGAVRVVAGGAGGPRIITATMQVILRVLLEDATASEAVGATRVHHQWSPDVVRVERGREGADVITSALRALGHTVEPIDTVAVVQVIRRSGAGWDAASDPRKGGEPAGW